MKLNTAKKLTAGALALSMMFAMAVPMAFAESMPEVDPLAPHITKKYTATNADTTSPTENFSFTATATKVEHAGVKADKTVVTVSDAPELTIADASYAAGGATVDGASKTLAISHTAPFPNVGVYYYTVAETASTYAGVTTHEGDMVLKVTVSHDKTTGDLKETYAFYTQTDGKGNPKGDKGLAVENTYSAGSLTLTKEVKGEMRDEQKEFSFDVEFTAPEKKTVESTITIIVAGDQEHALTIAPSDWANGKVKKTVSLKAGQSAIFENVPYEVTYTVTENGVDENGKVGEYAVGYDKNQNGEIKAKNITTIVTNEIKTEIDTGVILDNAPYMLMLAVVAGGAMMLVIKKRREEE